MSWKTITQNLIGQPIDSRNPTRRYDEGKRRNKGKEKRVCGKEGCNTFISIYNPTDFCALHTKPSV